jgi:uncharacterized RDD family membrane protein YckC
VHVTPHPIVATSFMDFMRLVNEHAHPYRRLDNAFIAFDFVDVGAVLLNAERRAIHDFLAGTYVVTVTSLRARQATSQA